MKLKRIHFLAAELFCYSYDNYEGHLGINPRFDKYMPEDAKFFEQAEKEEWSDERLAAETDFEIGQIPGLREKFRDALAIVDAESPAQSFLSSVRSSIEYAVEKGLNNEKDIDQLAGQICYRAADLSFILKQKDEPLWKYSKDLRSRADDIIDLNLILKQNKDNDK